jgi:hypothetical protein
MNDVREEIEGAMWQYTYLEDSPVGDIFPELPHPVNSMSWRIFLELQNETT